MNLTINNFIQFARDAQTRGLDQKAVIHLGDDSTNGLQDTKWQVLTRRDSDYKNANRQVRQELIDSVRTACGGVSLDKLPKEIKSALKLSDFKLDKDGKVTSQRPLTARRVEAITTAVVAWQNKCREASAAVDQSAIYLSLSESAQTEATNRLDRLFDVRRPLPANLSQSALESAGKAMCRLGLKPFQVRLALECLSDMIAGGVKVPTHGSPTDRLKDLAKQVAEAVGSRLMNYAGVTNALQKQHGNDRPLPARLLERRADGVGEGGVSTGDQSAALRLALQIFGETRPELAKIFDSLQMADLENLDHAQSDAFKAENAMSLENDELTNIQANARTPAQSKRLETLSAQQARKNSELLLLIAFYDKGGTRLLPPDDVKLNGVGVRPKDAAKFKDIIRIMNRLDPRTFSVDNMFVRGGKPGVDRFDPLAKQSFEGVDRKGFPQRANNVANAQAKFNIMAEMAKLANPEFSTSKPQFDNDYNRSNIIDESGKLLPGEEGFKDRLDDIFAQKLLRNDKATYSGLTLVERRKVMFMKAILNQTVEGASYYGIAAGRSEDCNRIDIGCIMANGQKSQENIYKFSFDDDGGMTVTLFRVKAECASINGFAVEEDDDDDSTIPMIESENNAINAYTRLDIHVPADQVDRIAAMDWEHFDCTQLARDFGDQNQAKNEPHFYENFMSERIPEAFRFNIEAKMNMVFELN